MFSGEISQNPSQLNILFSPSSETSVKALISFPKGNRKSMKTSTSTVSQVLQRGSRKINKLLAKEHLW